MNRMKKSALAALIAVAPAAAFAFQPLPLRPSTSSVEVVAPARHPSETRDPHAVRDRKKQQKELRKTEHARVKAERKRAREIRKAQHERQKELRKTSRR